MKLNIKAISLTAGILTAAGMLIIGTANLIWPDYGNAFLQIMDSVYPGYDANQSFVSVIILTLYALIDGFLSGLIFGSVYNVFAGRKNE